MSTTASVPTTRRSERPWRPMLVGGGILLIVGNAVHPLDADPTHLSRLEPAARPIWLPIHLTLALGLLLVTAGLVAVTHRIEQQHRGAAGQLARTASVVGGVLLVTVFGALDGYAVSALATSEVAGSTVEAAALAEESIDAGLAALGTLLLFGLAVIATSWALARGGARPRPVVWAGYVAGALGSLAGLVLLAQGPTPLAINVLLRPAAIAGTLWFVALGATFHGEVHDPAT